MNTDKIYAEQLANEYAPKDTSKVVAGNDAIRLYEKYGFQLSAQILRLDR